MKLLLTLTTISQVAFEVLFAVPIVLSNKVPALDGGGECSNCLPIVAGTLSSGSPTLPGKRLRLTGVPSGCGAPKLCPGETNQLGARRYNAHVFDNPGPEMCVSVALRVPCQGMLHASAHAYTLSPLWMCDNYRGDTGVAVAEGTGGFSFRVPAGAPFIILVNEVEPGAGCDNYTLELYGLPCPPPRLNIAHVPDLAQVRLSWSSAYLGFSLQRVASFNDPQFTDVPMVPTLIGLEYAVTNPASGTQSYFRLRKTLNE